MAQGNVLTGARLLAGGARRIFEAGDATCGAVMLEMRHERRGRRSGDERVWRWV